MRFTRLFSATLLVAAVTILSSCGESATTTPTDNAELAVGARDFTLSTNPSWSKEPADPIPTDTRTVLIGGVIAAAGYPMFGAWQYSGGGNGWLEMSTSPNFSRSPIGWNFIFKLKPSAASLPIGAYSVQIPVTVPAATNNPQMITVTFNNCGNCLYLGSVRTGEITADDPTMAHGSGAYGTPGSYRYDEWRLFLEPGQSAYVQMIGNGYALCSATGVLGTLSDPHLQIWTFPGLVFVGERDDYCGYASQVGNTGSPIVNGTGVRQEYRVRASQHASGTTGGLASPGYNYVGTYTIRVVSTGFFASILETGSSDAPKPVKIDN